MNEGDDERPSRPSKGGVVDVDEWFLEATRRGTNQVVVDFVMDDPSRIRKVGSVGLLRVATVLDVGGEMDHAVVAMVMALVGVTMGSELLSYLRGRSATGTDTER